MSIFSAIAAEHAERAVKRTLDKKKKELEEFFDKNIALDGSERMNHLLYIKSYMLHFIDTIYTDLETNSNIFEE